MIHHIFTTATVSTWDRLLVNFNIRRLLPKRETVSHLLVSKTEFWIEFTKAAHLLHGYEIVFYYYYYYYYYY
jgi:hypothetical protein